MAKCNYFTTQHVSRCASVLFLLFSWSQSTLEWERSVTETKGTAKQLMNKKLTKQKNLQISFGCGNSTYIQIIQPTSQFQAWKSLLTNKYADIIHILQQEFSSRFQYFRKLGWFQLFHFTVSHKCQNCFTGLQIWNQRFTVQ